MSELRAMWSAAVKCRHEAEGLKAQADMLSAKYNAALCAAMAEKCVPPGYEIDVLGDGKVKLAAECAKVPQP